MCAFLSAPIHAICYILIKTTSTITVLCSFNIYFLYCRLENKILWTERQRTAGWTRAQMSVAFSTNCVCIPFNCSIMKHLYSAPRQAISYPLPPGGSCVLYCNMGDIPDTGHLSDRLWRFMHYFFYRRSYRSWHYTGKNLGDYAMAVRHPSAIVSACKGVG